MVATRVFQRGIGHILTERPFQNGPGARLYVAAGDASDIIYRPNRAFDPNHLPLQPVLTRDLAVASVDSPTTDLTYNLPAALIGVPIGVQVRTFADDYENETIYRSVTTGSDGGGDQQDVIQGTAVIRDPVKLDGGGVAVRFWYQPGTDGVQPTQFALVQTSGPGSLADAVIDFSGGGLQEIQIAGLTDAATYGWRLEGRSVSGSVNLGSVTFTADASGPAGTLTLDAVEY